MCNLHAWSALIWAGTAEPKYFLTINGLNSTLLKVAIPEIYTNKKDVRPVMLMERPVELV